VTTGGAEPPQREPPVLGWRGRLEGLQRSIMRLSPVDGLLQVMRAYDRSGGGMLAGALSYFAFFTIVPSLLLFVGLLGVLVEDAALREELVFSLFDQIDPLSDLAKTLVDQLADTGRLSTIVGVLGLLWGASGFYGALQGAMQRVFPGPGGRDFFQTRLRGVVTVVFILGSMVLAVVIVFALPLLTEWITRRCEDLRRLDNLLLDEVCSIDFVQVASSVAIVGAMGIGFLAALVVYIAIPTDGPTFRQAFWPAVIVGIIVGLLTSLFGLLTPLIARQWVALGGIVGSVFLALVWLNLVFQVLVYGAAFARLRRDRERLRDGPPTF
jgi:membrane protein